MQLRRFDQAGRRAYLDEVRPRFVVLRLRAGKVNFTWGLPLWAAEEVAAFALGCAALLQSVLPLAPASWRSRLNTRLNTGITVAGREVRLGAPNRAENTNHAAPHTGDTLIEIAAY